MHPLLEIVDCDSAQEQDQVTEALKSHGWSPRAVGVAITEATRLAGRVSSRREEPILVLSDEQAPPSVFVRLPVDVSPSEAAELSWQLHQRLTEIELNRPGFSLSYLATLPEREVRRAA
jgi:hypothetical protein